MESFDRANQKMSALNCFCLRKESSAKAGSSLVRFSFMNSPAVLKKHSEGTDLAVVQKPKEAFIVTFILICNMM